MWILGSHSPPCRLQKSFLKEQRDKLNIHMLFVCILPSAWKRDNKIETIRNEMVKNMTVGFSFRSGLALFLYRFMGSTKFFTETGLIITYQKKKTKNQHTFCFPLQHLHHKIQTGINHTSESLKILLHKHTKMPGSIQMKIYISQLFLLLVVLGVVLRWDLHGTTGGGMTGGNNLGTGEKVAA